MAELDSPEMSAPAADPEFAPRARARRGRDGGQDGLVAVLDVGIAKTFCAIADVGPAGAETDARPVDLLGTGFVGAPGPVPGAAGDFESCARSIRFALEEAERGAGVTAPPVIAAYGGPGLSSAVVVGRIKLRTGHVGASDAAAALTAAVAGKTPAGATALHAVPIGYTIDDGPMTQDPRGAEGKSLAAYVCLVHAPTEHLQGLKACIEHAGAKVQRIVAAPYAAALGALSARDRVNAAVVDVGAGGARYAAFGPQGLICVGQVSMGGAHCTRALAKALATSPAAAERVKRTHATVGGPIDPNDSVEAPRLGADGRLEPACVLRAAIHATVRTHVGAVAGEVAKRLEAVGAGPIHTLAVTGGGSDLIYLREALAEKLGASLAPAGVNGVRGLEAASSAAPFSVAVGLVRWAKERPVDAVALWDRPLGAKLHRGGGSNLASRVLNWLRANF
jgi:cell division protein FtsA